MSRNATRSTRPVRRRTATRADAAGARSASSAPAARHQQTELLDGRRLRLALARDRALVHHGDAVGEGEDLVEVLADAAARRRPFAAASRRYACTVSMPGDVKPARRRSGDEHQPVRRRTHAQARPSAGCRPRAATPALADPTRGRRSAPSARSRELADRVQPEQRPARDRRATVRLEHDVRRDAQPRRDAGAEPVLGDVG